MIATGLALAAPAAAQTHPRVTGAAAAAPVVAADAPVVRPVVRAVPAPQDAAPGAPASASASPPAVRKEQFGDITRGLLGMQAGGLRAGPGLPLQGAVASAAWRRYMDSFEHPIPQWFGERVQSPSSASAR